MKKIIDILWRTAVYTVFFHLLLDPPGAVSALLPGVSSALILSRTHMSDLLLIDYSAYRSGLRGIDGLYKLIFFLLCLVLSIVSSSRLFHVLLFLFQGALTLSIGKIPLRRYLRFLEAPILFLLMGALGIMVQMSFSPLSLSVSASSLSQARLITWRSLCAISCLYSLSLSTPMNQMIETLRKIKIPETVIELMLILYRYIFVLFTLYYPMKRALSMRRGERIRGLGMLWSALLKRSHLRVEASFLSMNSRGYDGTLRFLSAPAKERKGLFMLAAASFLVIAGAWLL